MNSIGCKESRTLQMPSTLTTPSPGKKRAIVSSPKIWCSWKVPARSLLETASLASQVGRRKTDRLLGLMNPNQLKVLHKLKSAPQNFPKTLITEILPNTQFKAIPNSQDKDTNSIAKLVSKGTTSLGHQMQDHTKMQKATKTIKGCLVTLRARSLW